MHIGVRVGSWCVRGETERRGGNLRRGAFTALVVVFLMFVVGAVIVVMIVNVYGMTMVTIPVE